MSRDGRAQSKLLLSQLERSNDENSLLRSALDRLAVGVVLVDGGEAIFMNRCADDLLRRSNGGSADIGRLRAAHDERRHGDRVHCFALSAPDDTSLQIVCVPTAARSAVVFVSDPKRDIVRSEELMQQLFGLTGAEARVAIELANGRSIEEIARELAISTNTARSHLKRVFAKTETRRQGDMVRMIAATLAALDVADQ